MSVKTASAGDVLVTMMCKCGSVLVLESAADRWTCERGHSGSPGERFEIVERVATLDVYEPEHLAVIP